MNALKLIFENTNPMPLFMESQAVQGASWAKMVPERLEPGKTEGGYGVASTDKGFVAHFNYTVESHVLGVVIAIKNEGEITVDCNQSPPFGVAERSEKQGDTWVVTVRYSGPF